MNTGYIIEKQKLVALDKQDKGLEVYSLSKRAIDISIALCALIALAPLMLITATLIIAESPGSAFFKQIRVGMGGRHFTMWKFRSMRNDSECLKESLTDKADMSDGVRFKMKDDPRVTRIGQFIRKLSIDELPQLFNVLKGDMSLVGPRPALPDEVAEYTPWQRLRLNALPGITCIWQVSGRSDIPFLEQVTMDLEYIRKTSLIFDFKLLLMTIPAVLSARGAH